MSNINLNLYPSALWPGKFYGTTKINKMSPNDSVQSLPIRPIISNIGIATHHLSKYLASLLSPLRESEYTVKNSKSFGQKVKLNKIPSNYKMVSFNLESLFTNVSLDRTISIILNRIYNTHKLMQILVEVKWKNYFICAPRMFIFHLTITFTFIMMALLWG